MTENLIDFDGDTNEPPRASDDHVGITSATSGQAASAQNLDLISVHISVGLPLSIQDFLTATGPPVQKSDLVGYLDQIAVLADRARGAIQTVQENLQEDVGRRMAADAREIAHSTVWEQRARALIQQRQASLFRAVILEGSVHLFDPRQVEKGFDAGMRAGEVLRDSIQSLDTSDEAIRSLIFLIIDVSEVSLALREAGTMTKRSTLREFIDGLVVSTSLVSVIDISQGQIATQVQDYFRFLVNNFSCRDMILAISQMTTLKALEGELTNDQSSKVMLVRPPFPMSEECEYLQNRLLDLTPLFNRNCIGDRDPSLAVSPRSHLRTSVSTPPGMKTPQPPFSATGLKATVRPFSVSAPDQIGKAPWDRPIQTTVHPQRYHYPSGSLSPLSLEHTGLQVPMDGPEVGSPEDSDENSPSVSIPHSSKRVIQRPIIYRAHSSSSA